MKNYLNFLLFILIPAFSIGQEIDNSLLWEIKSPKSNKSSFLYGTIHMVKKEDFNIKEKVRRSFNSCSKLALEVDLNMSLKAKMDLAMSTLLPNNKRLDEFMSKTGQVVYVSATPGPFELDLCPPPTEQIIRPTGLLDPQVIVRSTSGQIDDLYSEIKDRVDNNERVLVTTITKAFSEEISAFFEKKSLKVSVKMLLRDNFFNPLVGCASIL